MTTYHYTRTKLSGGGYDVNHPSRSTPLAKEIETALPSKKFTVDCNDTDCDINFDVALSAGDKTTLDSTVSDHQNNV